MKCMIRIFVIVLSIPFFVTLTGCGDDPKKEDAPELITKVTLTFTPTEGDDIVVTAIDSDGDGPQDMVLDDINLAANTMYDLNITLANHLASPEIDITEEVAEENDEHLFLFSWTNNLFATPSGDGNIDSRSHEVDYQDLDENNYPVGLETRWQTINAGGSGKFRIVLKHQPGIKSLTSGIDDGPTDLDLKFDLTVEN